MIAAAPPAPSSAASASALFVLGGFTALQLKISAAIDKREARDAAAETLRKAEVLLLGSTSDYHFFIIFAVSRRSSLTFSIP